MLPMPVKIIDALMLAIAEFYIIRNLINSKQKLLRINTIPLIVLLVLPTCFLYETRYNTIVSLLTYLISIFVFKKIFNLSLGSSVLSCSFAVISVSIVDAILSTIEIGFITYEQARKVWYISLVNNMLISGLSYILSTFKVFTNTFQFVCKKVEKKQHTMALIFAVLMVIVMSLLYINITSIFKLDVHYGITLISIIIFFLLYYFYMDERNNYEKLNDEYNTVFNYVQNFENWIDDEQMSRHELKNSLSAIREITNDKKVIKKIDEILDMTIIVDDHYIEQLKGIPKGGLKGLLYYKIAIASNNNVGMVAEISPKVTEMIEELSEGQLRQICILLGIYLDNAIEAATLSKKKLVTLEVYPLNNQLQFVISNTYENKIPLEEIKKKGYSTKGEGRGKGLHYANKVVNKNKRLTADNILLNEFYIQKLAVN